MLFALRFLLTGAKMCFSINANKSLFSFFFFLPLSCSVYKNRTWQIVPAHRHCWLFFHHVDCEAENKHCYLTIENRWIAFDQRGIFLWFLGLRKVEHLGLWGPDRKLLSTIPTVTSPSPAFHHFIFIVFHHGRVFLSPPLLHPLSHCIGWGQNPTSQLRRQETTISWIAMWQPDGAPGIWKAYVKERKRFQYFWLKYRWYSITRIVVPVTFNWANEF